MPNYIYEYWEKIKSKEIIVSKKIKQMYRKVIDLLESKNSKYYFNEKRASKIISFIETFCCHVKGVLRGKPIKLELWQKAMLSVVFGVLNKETNKRKYKKWHLYIARKNGKTLLAACVLIYLMVADGEKGAELYSAATKQDQAKLAWDMARQIIYNSPHLSNKFNIKINGIFNGEHQENFFKPLSKDSKSLDGLNASGYLIDELHAITDNNIVDVLWDSTVVREQPLEIITTTMGTVRESTFDNKYDYDEKFLEGVFDDVSLAVFCYELDEPDEYKNIKNAVKANPNIGVSISEENVLEEIKKIENDKSQKSDVLCKRFNVRMTDSQAWLDFDVLNNKEIINIDEIKNKTAIGGFDLSQTGDLTAFTTMLFNNGKIVCDTMYWVTNDFMKQQEKQHKVPFRKWFDMGLLRISGQNKIDYHDIAEYVMEQYNKGIFFQKIMYDAWSATYLIDEISNFGYTKGKSLIPVRQGAQTLSIPMQMLEGLLKDKKLIYQNNPITKWCFSNAVLIKDRNGNWMIDKSNRDRKIDGCATILNCLVDLNENYEFYTNLNK